MKKFSRFKSTCFYTAECYTIPRRCYIIHTWDAFCRKVEVEVEVEVKVEVKVKVNRSFLYNRGVVLHKLCTYFHKMVLHKTLGFKLKAACNALITLGLTFIKIGVSEIGTMFHSLYLNQI